MVSQVIARRWGNIFGWLAIINGFVLAFEMRRGVTASEILFFGDAGITAMWAFSILFPSLAAWKANRYWLLSFVLPVALFFYGLSHMC
jgi:hypothetical protein